MPARPSLAYDQNGSPYDGGPLVQFGANNAGVQISTTPAFLHTINVTKAGTAWNLKLYDGLSATGTLVWDGDCNAISSFQVYRYCKIGLFAVISGTTPGALSIAYSDQLTY